MIKRLLLRLFGYDIAQKSVEGWKLDECPTCGQTCIRHAEDNRDEGDPVDIEVKKV